METWVLHGCLIELGHLRLRQPDGLPVQPYGDARRSILAFVEDQARRQWILVGFSVLCHSPSYTLFTFPRPCC